MLQSSIVGIAKADTSVADAVVVRNLRIDVRQRSLKLLNRAAVKTCFYIVG